MAITFGVDMTIDRGIEHTSIFWAERINQKTQTAITGKRFNYDNSRLIIRGKIEIRLITKAEADAFRAFIYNTVRFQRFQFDIIPEAYDDIGGGIYDGTDDGAGKILPLASFDGNFSTEDIVKPVGKANKFNLSIPYYKEVTPLAGMADHEGVVS